MTLLIDTCVVAPPDRVEFWAQSSYDVYHPLQIQSDETDRFSARMWGDWLSCVGFYRIAAESNTMSRTPADIAAGDPECLHLSVLLRGQLEGAQQHRTVTLKPGDMTGYDTSQPAIFRAPEPFDLLVLKLPRATLGKHASQLSRLTAVRIPGDRGLPRLAAQFFCGAAAGLADGTISRDDADLAEHVIDLVRRLYADLEAWAPPAQPRSRAELLLHAQAYIAANLGDADLDPEQVANACFISTRYLHRVFGEEGLSVCESIRKARLDRCRRDLINPALAHEPISTIATRWGLPNLPHFSRLFRAAFGCSAREFRRNAAQSRRDCTDEPLAPRVTAFDGPTQQLEHARAWVAAGREPTIP